jgi:hypothetical protein
MLAHDEAEYIGTLISVGTVHPVHTLREILHQKYSDDVSLE